ncbi:lithostathine-1-beta-like isoform X2 [Crassostrea virginica]
MSSLDTSYLSGFKMTMTGELPLSGRNTSAEDEPQQTATARHLNKKSIIIIIIFTLILVISVIFLAVFLTQFVFKETNTDKGTTAQVTLDPTHHCQGDTPKPTSCEDGWSYSNKSCYWYNAALLTWDDAEAACRLQSATLAEVTSEEEWSFIIQLALGTSQTWIAGKYSKERNDWVYSCSNSSKTRTANDDYVIKNEPGYCESVQIPMIFSRNCSNTYSSLCEGNFKYT